MLIAGILTLTTAITSTGTVPALIDEPLSSYYSKAVSAESAEPQKTLAMLKNLLLPEGASISVSMDGVPSEKQVEFTQAIRRGMELWRTELGLDMPFRMAKPKEEPDIKVSFVSKVPGASSSCKGEIRSKRQIQWNDKVHYFAFTAEIDVAKYATADRFMTEDELVHVFTHELGHALGLGDRPSNGFIMGPILLGAPTIQFAPEEIQAVRDFRKLLRSQIDRVTAKLSKESLSSTGPKVASFVYDH